MIPQFIANFSGCVDGRKRSFENPNWQDAYAWVLSGKVHLRKFLQNVVNHLVIKKEQARFAIWILDNIGGKHVTSEVKQLIIDEMKAMKRDPHRLSERAAIMVADAIVG